MMIPRLRHFSLPASLFDAPSVDRDLMASRAHWPAQSWIPGMPVYVDPPHSRHSVAVGTDDLKKQEQSNSDVQIIVSCGNQVGRRSPKKKTSSERESVSADGEWIKQTPLGQTVASSNKASLLQGEMVELGAFDEGYEGDEDTSSPTAITPSMRSNVLIGSSEKEAAEQAMSSEDSLPGETLSPVLWPSYKLEERHNPMLRTALVAQHRIFFLRCNKAIPVDEKVSVFVNEKLKRFTEATDETHLVPNDGRRRDSLGRSKSVTLSLTPSTLGMGEPGSPRIASPLGGDTSSWEPSSAPACRGRSLIFLTCQTVIESMGPEDKVAPSLHDIVALDDGHRLVVTDKNNACIKVLDELYEGHWTLKTQPLSGNPWSLSAFGNREVVVTLPVQHKLAFVKLPPGMRVLRTTRTMRSYTSVAVLDESYIAATYYGVSDQPGGVDVLDRTGNVHIHISPNDDARSKLLSKPRYMCVAANGDLLVTDWRTNRVFCFTMDSKIRWVWSHRDIRRPMGICCQLEWSKRKMVEWTIRLVDMQANIWHLTKQFNRIDILKQPKDATGPYISEIRGISCTIDGRVFITLGDKPCIIGLQ